VLLAVLPLLVLVPTTVLAGLGKTVIQLGRFPKRGEEY